MGFKRKREQQEFRQRLSPAEEALLKARPSIAHIGEPSRTPRSELFESLLHNLSEVSEEQYSELLEILRAVVYEQPHKIGYLGHAFSAVKEDLSFYVVEMAQDDLVKALEIQDWPRFKVVFRFLCALHPIIANTDVLIDCLDNLLHKVGALIAEPATVNVAAELYKSALLASLYLPREWISEELREKFVSVSFPVPESSNAEFFNGEDRPYKPHTVGYLLVESAKNLKEKDWDAKILAKNPLVTSSIDIEIQDGEEPKEGPHGETKDDIMEDIKDDVKGTEDAAVKSDGVTQVTDQKTAEENAREDSTQAPEDDATGDVNEGNEEKPAEKTRESKKKHNIQSIHLPEVKSGPRPLGQELYFQAFLPADGVRTVPAETDICAHLLRDVAVDNIMRMDFNRREVVRQLLVLDEFFASDAFAEPGIRYDQLLEDAKESPEKPTWKIEDIAVEAILAQMFDISQPSSLGLPQVYFHTLLIEACVLAPQDLGPVVGRGVRFLFNNLTTADAEVIYRMVDWFAQHVSNFNFTWKWNEWLDTLQLPPDHPKQVFIREFLAKQVRLSYPERVREVIPPEFADLVPNPPDVPSCKYEDNKDWQDLVQSLRDTDGGNIVSGDGNNSQDPHNVLSHTENASDLLIHAICHLGNRSVTHASTWIHKTEKLILEFCSNKENIVAAVMDYWSQSKWVGALVIDQFVKIDAVSVAHIIEYVASKSDMLLSAVGWELLSYDSSLSARVLEPVTIDGEYGTWWKERLVTAFKRRADLNDWAAEYVVFSKSLGDSKAEATTDQTTATDKTAGDVDTSEKAANDESHEDREDELPSTAPKKQKIEE